mmetsp:Transcript_28659/g.80082  ORF Transcript_28659/g.80082 Transcript_28659/m.80082 type:complete len:425 (+) Transcript_28659:1403-2677(+)
MVEHAPRKSESPNSNCLDHPSGVYRSRSWTTEWNHDRRKNRRVRSRGSCSMRLALIALNADRMFAFTPGGGSNTNTRDWRTMLDGSAGWMSAVRNRRKSACGFTACSFFSSETSHWGARWQFLSRTHEPFFTPSLIARSANSKPSAEPSATDLYRSRGFRTSTARSSTRKLASYPGVEHSRIGDVACCAVVIARRSSSGMRRNSSPNTAVMKRARPTGRRSGRRHFSRRRVWKASCGGDPPPPCAQVANQDDGTRSSALCAARNAAHSSACSDMCPGSAPCDVTVSTSSPSIRCCFSSNASTKTSGSRLRTDRDSCCCTTRSPPRRRNSISSRPMAPAPAAEKDRRSCARRRANTIWSSCDRPPHTEWYMRRKRSRRRMSMRCVRSVTPPRFGLSCRMIWKMSWKNDREYRYRKWICDSESRTK